MLGLSILSLSTILIIWFWNCSDSLILFWNCSDRLVLFYFSFFSNPVCLYTYIAIIYISLCSSCMNPNSDCSLVFKKSRCRISLVPYFIRAPVFTITIETRMLFFCYNPLLFFIYPFFISFSPYYQCFYLYIVPLLCFCLICSQIVFSSYFIYSYFWVLCEYDIYQWYVTAEFLGFHWTWSDCRNGIHSRFHFIIQFSSKLGSTKIQYIFDLLNSVVAERPKHLFLIHSLLVFESINW